MNHFEFKSYTPTPTDQYMLGIAKIKLYGRLIVNFKHVKTKDGSGTFYCTNNYTLLDAMGEKKYLPCVQLDSRDDEDMLMEFIRDNVNRAINQRSVHQAQSSQTAAIHYPHGMAQNQPVPHSMKEVAENEQLPF
jgi:hypothetical protein